MRPRFPHLNFVIGPESAKKSNSFSSDGAKEKQIFKQAFDQDGLIAGFHFAPSRTIPNRL